MPPSDSGNARIWSSETITNCGNEFAFASGPCNDEFDNGGVPLYVVRT